MRNLLLLGLVFQHGDLLNSGRYRFLELFLRTASGDAVEVELQEMLAFGVVLVTNLSRPADQASFLLGRGALRVLLGELGTARFVDELIFETLGKVPSDAFFNLVLDALIQQRGAISSVGLVLGQRCLVAHV